jgi:hypothetical protein
LWAGSLTSRFAGPETVGPDGLASAESPVVHRADSIGSKRYADMDSDGRLKHKATPRGKFSRDSARGDRGVLKLTLGD